MEVTAKLNNIRIAPRKVRQVVDLVRGKKVQDALALLSFTVNKPARAVEKLINSAVASAKNTFHLDETALVIHTITVDEGIKLKRWHPMSRGRAYPIIKRSSHIALILSDKNSSKPEVVKTEKKETVKVKKQPAVAKAKAAKAKK